MGDTKQRKGTTIINVILLAKVFALHDPTTLRYYNTGGGIV
jgi:hypothetical protein